jgi:hypothetical protein
LKQIDTEVLMGKFVLLFIALGEVVLNDQKDVIAWKWTRSEEYSAATIWKAKSEAKCCFFAWLAAWKKAPTADNLLK